MNPVLPDPSICLHGDCATFIIGHECHSFSINLSVRSYLEQKFFVLEEINICIYLHVTFEIRS
jgi:hypothetical protein